MMYKTEFHVHTRYSKDSILSFWIIYVICKLKRISTIVITDHNEIEGAIKFKNKFKKRGVELIVGEEIFTSKGEIIGINLSKKIEPYLTPSETIKQIKKQKGIVYIPHPYDEKRYKTVLAEEEIKKNINNIDLIEIHNGRNVKNDFSIKQNEIAEKYNLNKVIGSDSHTFFELGRNYILTKNKIIDKLNLTDLENVEFKQKKCLNCAHFCTKIVRLIKIIGKGDINEILRIINRKCKKRN